MLQGRNKWLSRIDQQCQFDSVVITHQEDYIYIVKEGTTGGFIRIATSNGAGGQHWSRPSFESKVGTYSPIDVEQDGSAIYIGANVGALTYRVCRCVIATNS